MPWGVAAAGVAAAGSVYAANKNANTITQSQQQNPQVQQATDTALSQAESIAGRPYTPYTGSVVAPLSQNEQTASGLAQTGGTQAQSYLTSAGQELSGIKDYSTSNLQPYMDPYVANVLQPELAQENINYQGQRSALENSKAGAFGGDRSALDAQSLNYVHSQTIASDVGNAYSAAFTNAQTAFFNDQNKKIQTANALATVGGDVSKLNTQQIQDLMATGGIERMLQQSQLDFDYSQFLQNRDWSVTNLQPLLNAIGTAKGVSQTSTTTGPQSGIAGEAIGAAATIAGMYFTGNSSNKTSVDPNTGLSYAAPPGYGSSGTAVQGYDPNLQPGMVYNG